MNRDDAAVKKALSYIAMYLPGSWQRNVVILLPASYL